MVDLLNWWKDTVYQKKRSSGVDTIAEHQALKMSQLMNQYSDPNSDGEHILDKEDDASPHNHQHKIGSTTSGDSNAKQFCRRISKVITLPSMLPYSVVAEAAASSDEVDLIVRQLQEATISGDSSSSSVYSFRLVFHCAPDMYALNI